MLISVILLLRLANDIARSSTLSGVFARAAEVAKPPLRVLLAKGGSGAGLQLLCAGTLLIGRFALVIRFLCHGSLLRMIWRWDCWNGGASLVPWPVWALRATRD